MVRHGVLTALRAGAAALGVTAVIGSVALVATSASATSVQSSATPAGVSATVVADAKAIAAGHKEKGWNGGRVPYSWGAGHGEKPGPTLGTCVGYTGSIHPCPADHTKGVDCSGLVRWVFYLAYGKDVFGSGNTNDQVENQHVHRVSNPQPGDLVFYGTSTSNTHHVGIYVGDGKMIDALETGTDVRTDSVHAASGLLGYYRYS